jgi:hypothetical protein
MAPSKTISFYFQDNFIHTVDITSDMSEEDTYAAIRTKLAPLLKDEDCIEIWDPGNNHNFVRIHYTCLKWPIKFTSGLHKLAACTKDRHDEVMQVLRHQVQIGVQHAQNAVAVVTGEVIRAVASIMGAQMVDSTEDREDMEETERFAGGLGEAVEDALEEGEEGAAVSWEYKQEGRFNIAMR